MLPCVTIYLILHQAIFRLVLYRLGGGIFHFNVFLYIFYVSNGCREAFKGQFKGLLG